MSSRLKMLPKVVFSMSAPFTKAQACAQIREEVSIAELGDVGLGLVVDIYLENLVRYGVLLRQSYSANFSFSGLGNPITA